MNIRCPHCQTLFRVDPTRIPTSGVRARCARCGEVFTVHPPGEGGGGPTVTGGARSGGAGKPAAPAPAAAGPPASAPHPDASPAAPPAPPAAAPAPPPGAPAAPFGSADSGQRAARLARALVSDIVAYHPERRESSLAAGTLRAEFREEILKSWEEYVAQVGLETAKSTPHFRDALNAILARGQPVF
ncbi:MAG TPA: zinc-ribbon domain-containing protein [Longimicrobiales bacterium]|nr:zinc-ribbon domain-containing protein [Longimicrobiales bacterium]